MLERIRRFLTGHDIFISYSRHDGTDYATKLAIALTDLKCSCLFDQWSAAPGKRIPRKLKQAIRLSSLCVVVGTPSAGASEHVKEELDEFLRSGCTIIPISFDGAAPQAKWWPKLAGLKWESEEHEALTTGPRPM